MRRLVVGVLLLTACMDEGPIGPAHGSGDAQLMILNALEASDQAELRLDGWAIPLPQAGRATSSAIGPGAHRLELRSIYNNELLASADFAVPAGGRRSAVLGGAVQNTVALLVATDTASLPPANAAKVRVVHTVPKAPIYDAYLTAVGQAADHSARFVTPFTFGAGINPEFPGYAVRSPGMYQVTLKATGTQDVLLQGAAFEVQAGQVFSVVLAQSASGALELRTIRER